MPTGRSGRSCDSFRATSSCGEPGRWAKQRRSSGASALFASRSSSGYFHVGHDAGGAYASIYDGTYKSALAACTATNWTKLAAKFSGGTLSVRANGGSWATASVTDIDLVTGLLNMGIGYGSAYYEGLVAEIMTAQSALSDGEFDGLDAYVLARYGV